MDGVGARTGRRRRSGESDENMAIIMVRLKNGEVLELMKTRAVAEARTMKTNIDRWVANGNTIVFAFHHERDADRMMREVLASEIEAVEVHIVHDPRDDDVQEAGR